MDTFGIDPTAKVPKKPSEKIEEPLKQQKTVKVEEDGDAHEVEDVAMKEDDDDEVVIEAAIKNGSNLGPATWIGRLSYQWFCMEEKLNVLHSCFPNFQEVPLYIDITREVNRRWKALSPARKQHYIEIATYQYETEFGPVDNQTSLL